MKVTPKNVIPGSKITYKGEPYFVYKVNDKTIYIGKEPYDSLKELLSVKKIIEAIDYIKGIKVNYSDELDIKESDIIAISAKEISNKKRYLTLFAEQEVKRLYAIYKKNNGKSYRHNVEMGSKEFKILACNEKNQVLISFEGNLFFYDIEFDFYTYFRNLFDTSIKANPIPWPQK